jgi:hypothetical protein
MVAMQDRFLLSKRTLVDSCSLPEVDRGLPESLLSEEKDVMNISVERWLRRDGDWWTEMVMGSGKTLLHIVAFGRKCDVVKSCETPDPTKFW